MSDLQWYELTECFLCQGTGKLKVQGRETPVPEEENCPMCEGQGKQKVMRR